MVTLITYIHSHMAMIIMFRLTIVRRQQSTHTSPCNTQCHKPLQAITKNYQPKANTLTYHRHHTCNSPTITITITTTMPGCPNNQQPQELNLRSINNPLQDYCPSPFTQTPSTPSHQRHH